MNFKQHAIIGAASSGIIAVGSFALTKNPAIALTFGVSLFVGSIIPDIDTGSIPSRIFAVATIILAGILMYFGLDKHAAIVGIINAALRIDKHRGYTHSWLLIIVCSAIGIVAAFGKIPEYFVLLAPFAVGLIVHYLVDR